jgi:hypothetical protein
MPDFAHPIEHELARLFDERGIAWEYESSLAQEQEA